MICNVVITGSIAVVSASKHDQQCIQIKIHDVLSHVNE